MKSSIYVMLFQMLCGIWLFTSPLAMEFENLNKVTFMDVILGATVTMIGLGLLLHQTAFTEGEQNYI